MIIKESLTEKIQVLLSKIDLEELNHIIVRKALERKKRPVPLSAYVRELVKKEIERVSGGHYYGVRIFPNIFPLVNFSFIETGTI